MKKNLLLFALLFLVGHYVSGQCNLLKNGNFEEQGAWKIAQGNLADTIFYEFGSTENEVNGGEGGNLALKHVAADESNDNITIYQPLDLVAGKTYIWSCAMRDLSANWSDGWWIKYAWVALEPTAGSDPEEKDINGMHWWMAEKTKDFNGLLDTFNVETNEFIPELDATYYVGINFGVNNVGSDMHFILDEIAFIDPELAPCDATSVNNLPSVLDKSLSIYPNPASSKISFSYSLKKNSDVELILTNVLGQHVATISSTYETQGEYTKTFDCSHLNRGMYYGVLKINNSIVSSNTVVIK